MSHTPSQLPLLLSEPEPEEELPPLPVLLLSDEGVLPLLLLGGKALLLDGGSQVVATITIV